MAEVIEPAYQVFERAVFLTHGCESQLWRGQTGTCDTRHRSFAGLAVVTAERCLPPVSQGRFLYASAWISRLQRVVVPVRDIL